MTASPPISVVWFKRDLRLVDHAPLVQAAAGGRVLPVYVVEDDYWKLPETSFRQWEFLSASVSDLSEQIETLGGTLRIERGRVTDVFEALRSEFGTFDIYAHEETGNDWTFQRDIAVREWCTKHDVAITEDMQFGVWRGAEAKRARWASRWDTMMAEPIPKLPDIQWVPTVKSRLPTSRDLGLDDDGITLMQKPGRPAALERLNCFLYEAGENYQKDMSTPIEGENGCSRMSAYLSVGSISVREVYQATHRRQNEIRELPAKERGKWAGALRSFIGRLHWHCHFTQKLEAEPEIEYLPMARTYVGLRPQAFEHEMLEAFANGQTGYPFVDACMRYLRATGWINFRMRAMLMSFASYNLWLPWQASGTVLARLFTDYEPGIHWPQSQMQSGETGINAVRIYSPVKQGFDQDPTGAFTRRWVPELAHLPDSDLQEPWLASGPPTDYPAPIVDYRTSTASAKAKIYDLRRTDKARAEAAEVVEKHGSRKPRRTTKYPTALRSSDAAS